MTLGEISNSRNSDEEWLGNIPSHWTVKRLKYVCRNLASNVDKKSVENQQSILLCNYTDVYYNDEIVDGMSFMPATASDEQIEKFTLRANDVIITKDSESADDIAVSAYVPEDIPGVVCGYHLAILRPNDRVNGKFIKWLFDSKYLRAKVAVLANGLTRVGLSYAAIGGLELPSPIDTREQFAVASFLDAETAKIDALVAEQRRLIELLKEKRQAVISHAVTKGLNPDAPMKPSGIEWLGDVPKHWKIGPVKRFFRMLNSRRIPLSSEVRASRQGTYPYYGASGVVDSIDDYIFDEDLVLVSEDGANLVNRTTPIAFVARGKYWVNNHAHILKPLDKSLVYWAERIESINLSPFVTGSAQPKFTADALLNLTIAVPPTEDERTRIENHIASQTEDIDRLSELATSAIGLLNERRTALISAAVTGKIDVRNYQPDKAA